MSRRVKDTARFCLHGTKRMQLHGVPTDGTNELIGNYVLDSMDYRIISAGSNDNCTAEEDLIIEIYPNEFTCTEVGDIQFVNVIVTDEAGNQGTCVAEITVIDSLPPSAVETTSFWKTLVPTVRSSMLPSAR